MLSSPVFCRQLSEHAHLLTNRAFFSQVGSLYLLKGLSGLRRINGRQGFIAQRVQLFYG